MGAVSADRRARLFFALWPPDEAARTLRRYAESIETGARARLMPARNIHLTLAFLGDTPAPRIAAAGEAARGVRGRGFSLELDRAAYWPRGRILWAGPDAAPPGLVALADALRGALVDAGFAPEARPFAAHVTLVRKARRPDQLPPPPPVTWSAREFALVESVPIPTGSRYETLERFPLGQEQEEEEEDTRR